MPDYSKAKLYKIWSPSTDEIYVGSTIQTLSNRMSGHRTHLKKYKAGKTHYRTSFKILEYGDARIELLEKYDTCTCRDELLAREGKYIRELNCVNRCVAGRTKKQWYEDNKEAIKAKKKQYREDNKEAIKTKKKQYYVDNKEAIKAKVKEYAEKNKDKKKEYDKTRYKANNKIKVQCECGATINKHSLKKHQRTIKHKKLMQN
jgi:hypothetical protein